MVWTRWLSIAGIIWFGGLLVASALPGGLALPTSVILASAVLLVLPGFLLVVVRGAPLTRTGSRIGDARAFLRLLRAAMPVWLLIASWLLFAGFWLVGLLSMIGTTGVAEQRAGTYVVNNGGETTVISEAEYQTLKTQDQRNTIATAGAFCVGVAVISTALLRRRADEAVRP